MVSALRTVIVGGDADSSALLKELLTGTTPTWVVVGEFRQLSQAVQEGPARRPELVIVDLTADEAGGSDGPPAKVVEALGRAFPEAAVFAIGPSVSADFVIEVIRAGAVEFLRRPVQRADLSAAVEKLVRLRRGSQPAARAGRITSVFSTKGGLGVTTLATNLAVCLAESSSTILIDLDTRQSDVATFLNLRPTYSLLDALENLERLDESFLQGLLVKHASGLQVLPGPTRIERSHLSADQVQSALQIIRSHFDHVVLDLRHDFDPGTIAALEASSTILYLTSLTVSALRSGSAGLAALRHLGLNLQRVKVVVMRDGTGEDVTLKHAQEALGLPIYWRTPSDYPTVVSSINSGEPVVTAAPRSKIARTLRDLAAGLYRPGSPARPDAALTPSLIRLVWNPKGVLGDG